MMYRQQLCNQRNFFSHNVEMNNKGILLLDDNLSSCSVGKHVCEHPFAVFHIVFSDL